MPKIPSSIRSTLHNLHQAVGGLQRGNVIEAQKYVRESLANTKNESEWTFNTDDDLVSTLNYLEALDTCISIAVIQSTTCNKALIATIIEEIQELNKALEHILAEQPTHQSPDQLDDIEKAHRRAQHASGSRSKT